MEFQSGSPWPSRKMRCRKLSQTGAIVPLSAGPTAVILVILPSASWIGRTTLLRHQLRAPAGVMMFWSRFDGRCDKLSTAIVMPRLGPTRTGCRCHRFHDPAETRGARTRAAFHSR